MSKPAPALMTPALLWVALRYVLAGRLALRDGHLPPAGHTVPADFVGVGIAAADDPAGDAVILARLQELGVRQVRLDFSYGDPTGPAARLLEQLLAADIRVLLHLVQPFEAARSMPEATAQAEWQAFVDDVLARYGSRIAAVEIGSTINRRRWAGYGCDGFFAAWSIAHAAARRHGVTLAGPSVTDFEPLYNIAVLSRLKQAGQLPDIHTDNLFSERVTEPERFDHRIIGFHWARRLKVNLVKKARLLRNITRDFGVAELVSPAAFWTLPRIQRLLPDGEQKQADYLARYFLLCAASGALRQAYWGPLVCSREGLVDDGSHRYPPLERITHYQSALGQPADYRPRPAFAALRAFAGLIPGMRYEGAPHTTQGLEIHAFRSGQRYLHAVWTANGKAVPLAALYTPDDLARASGIDRDGHPLPEIPALASEAPIYLCWPSDAQVSVAADLPADAFVAIHRHQPGQHHYMFDADGWRGILLASGPEEAARLRDALHPAHLQEPTREALLRKARNAIWTIADARAPGGKLVVKKPLKMHPHKRLLDRFKPSKARRSWDAAAELLRRGIRTAAPIAYFEQPGDRSLTQNYYICDFVAADFSARDMLSAFAAGASEYMGIASQEAYRQLCQFLLQMHGRGVYFRDLSGGNILIRKLQDGQLEFTLIDINRAHFFNHPTVLSKRIADLTRVCNKLHWAGREALIGQYLQALGQDFTLHRRLPFHLYDFKVWSKRHLGRKAIKRLFSKD